MNGIPGFRIDGELQLQGIAVPLLGRAVHKRPLQLSLVRKLNARRGMVDGLREARAHVVGGDELRQDGEGVQDGQEHHADQGQAMTAEPLPNQLPLRGQVVAFLLAAGGIDRVDDGRFEGGHRMGQADTAGAAPAS